MSGALAGRRILITGAAKGIRAGHRRALSRGGRAASRRSIATRQRLQTLRRPAVDLRR